VLCVCILLKITLNARIVVIGASEVGISFLETFAFWFVDCDDLLLLLIFTV